MQIPIIDRLFSSKKTAWGDEIQVSGPCEPTDALLKDAEDKLSYILERNLLPFWVNEERLASGLGHLVLRSPDGNAQTLNLILTTRYLWFVSALAGSAWKHDLHRELATETYLGIRRFLFDTQSGGFFWEVDAKSGKPIRAKKHLYGQAFAIYALSEYARATGDSSAIELAGATLDRVEAHGHDNQYGGYRECLLHDWGYDHEIGYLGWRNPKKLVNSHLHMLEALAALYRVAPSSKLEARIEELKTLIDRRTVIEPFGVSFDVYHNDWKRVRSRDVNSISYGHGLESIYLYVSACVATDRDFSDMLPDFRRRFSYCTNLGFDFENGGFFEFGPLGRRATGRRKIWWVQAEALLTSLLMFRLTQQGQYLSVFTETLDWIVDAQIDWSGGEWHQHVEESGETTGELVGPWKGPYHNGRSTLTCLRLLDRASDLPSCL